MKALNFLILLNLLLNWFITELWYRFPYAASIVFLLLLGVQQLKLTLPSVLLHLQGLFRSHRFLKLPVFSKWTEHGHEVSAEAVWLFVSVFLIKHSKLFREFTTFSHFVWFGLLAILEEVLCHRFLCYFLIHLEEFGVVVLLKCICLRNRFILQVLHYELILMFPVSLLDLQLYRWFL